MAALEPIGWERMIRAVQRVRERVVRAAGALERVQIPYCLIGDNAIEAHVRREDESAVRTSKDVELLIRRSDLYSATAALESDGIEVILDGSDVKARDAVHILFANEKVRPEYDEPAPDVTDSEAAANFRVISLPAIVKMKLTSFRDKDRTHLRDLIDVGLLDGTWPSRLPEKLANRLQQLLDTPDG